MIRQKYFHSGMRIRLTLSCTLILQRGKMHVSATFSIEDWQTLHSVWIILTQNERNLMKNYPTNCYNFFGDWMASFNSFISLEKWCYRPFAISKHCEYADKHRNIFIGECHIRLHSACSSLHSAHSF